MAVGLDSFYAACPGVLLTPDIATALAGLPAGSSAAAIQAVVLPLVPQGNPGQYTAGAPSYPLMPMPGTSPILAAALPAYPAGLPLFQDSNPDPTDGWSVERSGLV